ncbi:regulator of nonsense transcripts 3B [Nerophis lumbriciformis]|uniref:regulator of nonsense transcripts 3B n=1 Tax=Nerophis lumbriciformis TaxID=546530 RepID=UPI002ADFF5D3|nr:regulator of nonsense transcripts 3B-like [Nerophis lumbriciformis]
MMEDKENTRPREKRVEVVCEDAEKGEKLKEKKEAMTKIVIRRLPPSLTKEELEEQLQPLPEVDYLEFFSNDTSLYPHLFARAYINFKNQEDIVLFRDRFDGYVFIDNRGQEYTAIVEFAPFQKTSKKRSKNKDAKCGTITKDPDYKKFLDFYNGDDEKFTSTPETLLEEIEARTKELVAKKTTPLLDFLKNKQRIREEKKEERRRREVERKRLRDEERRKWREERKRKGVDKIKKLDKLPESDKEQVKEEPKIKLLKKPDRGEEADSDKTKEKFKKAERSNKEDRTTSGGDQKRRHNDNREERGKRVDEEGTKEFRERDGEREPDKERRQREKERVRRQDEERRRRRERQDGENARRRRAEDDGVKKERERLPDKKRGDNAVESEKMERPPRENRKDDGGKRERLRNKDRPAIQLYQPGARNRSRPAGEGGDSSSVDRKPDAEAKKTSDKGED